MVNVNAWTRLAVATSLFASVGIAGQKKTGEMPTLSAQDRAEIQQLSASYARALGTCAAEEYANLFESPNGFYESLIRGRVMGQARLIALVKSERQCSQPPAERSARPAPAVNLEVTPEGIVGKIPLDSGHYEDVYVKTAAGWRFKSRNNIPKKAEDAGFTYRDFAAIRELAGDNGQLEDVYIRSPDGLVFRSGGMTIDPVSRQEAIGIVHLKDDDGRYEDVYERTAKGWRFKSRTYNPSDPAPGSRPTR